MLLPDMASIMAVAGLVKLGASASGGLPPVVLGRVPEGPDALVALNDYGGRAPEPSHSGPSRRFPRFQVVVRDPDPVAARTRMEAIWLLLDATRTRPAFAIGGTDYEVVRPLSEPFELQVDAVGRVVMACNFEARWA